MSTIDTHASSAPASSGALACVADWIGTTDHKRIGRLYLGSAAVAFVGSAVVGVLLGIERISPTREWLPVKSLTQLFAVERFGLTFLVLLPAMVGAALAVVPLQDVAGLVAEQEGEFVLAVEQVCRPAAPTPRPPAAPPAPVASPPRDPRRA